MAATNIVDYAVANTFDNLVEAVTFADLGDALSDEAAALTLFAPAEGVFEDGTSGIRVPAVNRWNKDVTAKLLKHHVVADNKEAYIADGAKTPLEGLDLAVTGFTDNTVPKVNGLLYTEATQYTDDVNAANGYVIFSIDSFLVPVSQSSNDLYTTTLLTAAGERLGDRLAEYATDEYSPENLYAELLELYTAGSDKIFSADLAYNVFLPTQAAFTQLSDEVIAKKGTVEYLEDGGLEIALRHHITTGATALEDKDYTSLSSTPITVSATATKVTIAGVEATITTAEPLVLQNGQVNDIDRVLQFPRLTTVETATATDLVSTVTELFVDNDLIATLDELTKSTVFAPTNDAIKPLVTYADWNTVDITAPVLVDILKHHIVDARLYSTALPEEFADIDGEDIEKSEISLVQADVICTNGNIHIIDNVLIPLTLAPLIPASDTVVDVAIATADTSKLVEFVQLAGLVDDLSVVEPGTSFTVFAPTNEAFAKLSAEDLTFLTNNNNEKLTEVLKYHVVASAALAGSLEATQVFPTLVVGSSVTVTSEDDVVTVGTAGATVVVADAKAINGVVHVINQVLIPPGVVLPSSLPAGPSATAATPDVPPAASSPGAASSLVVSAITTAIAAFLAL